MSQGCTAFGNICDYSILCILIRNENHKTQVPGTWLEAYAKVIVL